MIYYCISDFALKAKVSLLFVGALYLAILIAIIIFATYNMRNSILEEENREEDAPVENSHVNDNTVKENETHFIIKEKELTSAGDLHLKQYKRAPENRNLSNLTSQSVKERSHNK